MSTAPLPPLPPVPGVADDDIEFGGPNMLDLLDQDHHLLRQLCTRAETSADAAEVLVATLARHLSAEEQYLYPTVRKVLPDGAPIASREVAEDNALLADLRRLHSSTTQDTAREAALAAVTARIHDHTHRTGADMFPRLREQCSDAQLVRLGNRIEIARGAAPTRPHPGTPATPPLNKLVDPAYGVVDKLRDVLSRRTTWAEDLS